MCSCPKQKGTTWLRSKCWGVISVHHEISGGPAINVAATNKERLSIITSVKQRHIVGRAQVGRGRGEFKSCGFGWEVKTLGCFSWRFFHVSQFQKQVRGITSGRTRRHPAAGAGEPNTLGLIRRDQMKPLNYFLCLFLFISFPFQYVALFCFVRCFIIILFYFIFYFILAGVYRMGNHWNDRRWLGG